MADYNDLTNIADTLKNVYGSALTNQFAEERTTYNQFPKSGRAPRGNGYIFGARVARSQGTGARRESEVLPEPLAGKFDQGLIKPRYIYGVLRLTGPAIEAAKGDVGAFVDSLADGIDDIYQSLISDLNRQACGDGFGLLGTLSAQSDALTTSSTTWTVTFDNDLGTRRMVAGQLVDFFVGSAIDQSAIASRISYVDHANKLVEMEFNDSRFKALHPIIAARSYTVATDVLAAAELMVKMGSREASHATSNVPVEITGLDGIYDDGTLLAVYENITLATNPWWKANVLGNSSVNRELSIDLMLQALDLARTQSQRNIKTMRMGLGQRRKYANLLMGDVRFQPTELRGGYETLTFSGGDGTVKMVIDPDLSPNKIYCEPDGVIQKYELSALGWGNLDQQIHQRAGYDEWDQFLRIYTNLGAEQRNCLVLLKDLIEPSLYT